MDWCGKKSNIVRAAPNAPDEPCFEGETYEPIVITRFDD